MPSSKKYSSLYGIHKVCVATMNPSSKGSIETLWQPLKSLLTSADLNKMFSCMSQESFSYMPGVTCYMMLCFTLVFGKSIINILC